MKILVDIGHPAHVHLSRNFILEMKQKGHPVWVTVKDIPAAKELLRLYGIDFIDLGQKKDALWAKAINQLKYDLKILRLVNKEKIEFGLGSSVSIAHISRLTSMKSFIFDDDDDEIEPFFVHFVHPFADYLFSPDCLQGRRKSKKNFFYPGYHELAYLHPNRFTPDPSVLQEARLAPGETYFVMRFNVFKAHHDRDVFGLTLEQKLTLVELLEKKGKVFITTERQIEPQLSRFRLPISPEKIHSFLYYASLFVGDSQTMTSEAAILGTPALKCNSLAGKLSVPNEIEKKYGLCFSFTPDQFPQMLSKIKELIDNPQLDKEWSHKKNKLLSEKIDVTSYMVNLIENFPGSVER